MDGRRPPRSLSSSRCCSSSFSCEADRLDRIVSKSRRTFSISRCRTFAQYDSHAQSEPCDTVSPCTSSESARYDRSTAVARCTDVAFDSSIVRAASDVGHSIVTQKKIAHRDHIGLGGFFKYGT